MRKTLYLLSSILISLTAPALWAATIQVNTQTDLFMDGSACSLRDAIESFNNAPTLSGGCTKSSADGFGTNDTIILPAGQYNLTLSGAPEDNNASGDLDIETTVVNPLLIMGADPADPSATVIDALMLSPRDRVLHILGTGLITLDSVTISNGHAPDGMPTGLSDGGGILVNQSGCLGLLNSVVRLNRAGDGTNVFPNNNGGRGGGIAIEAATCTINIANSLIEQNQAGNGAVANFMGTDFAGSGGQGGGMVCVGTMTMDETTVRNNRGGDGADNPTFLAGGGGIGGGIFLSPLTSGQDSSITRSTFNDNQAGNGGDSGSLFGGFGGGGGAIFYAAPFLGGSTITLSNNTIHANHAGNGGTTGAANQGGGGGPGGGLSFLGGSMIGAFDTAKLNNNTISENSAGLGGAGTPAGFDGTGGGVATSAGVGGFTVDVANTILANNTVGPTGAGPNCAPFPVDSGFNLETGTDCNFIFFAGDKQNANPALGPLQDNGGPTFTQALLAGSDALDGGNDGLAPGSGFPACEADDQRGVSRPQGSACDIGAFEAQTADLAVTKTASSAQVAVGDNLQFTVTVTNNGPTDADFVMVDDTLPAGLTFVSATPDQGACLFSAGLVMCDLGTIVAGDSVQILIVSTASVEGTQTNNVTTTFPGTDPDDSNNTASVTFEVIPGVGGGGDLSGSGCNFQPSSSGEVGWAWFLGPMLLWILYLIHRRRTSI